MHHPFFAFGLPHGAEWFWIFLAIVSVAFALVGLGGRNPQTTSRGTRMEVPAATG